MRSSRCFGMTRCGVLRPAAPHVLPQHRRIAVASLKGRQHACEAATRGQTSRCSATASDSSSDATCEANAEDQQRIAAVASVVLRWAAHSLNETLQDYLEQLKEVQGDSQRGFVFRGLNAWTVRLLNRKIAFTEARLSAITSLAGDVDACSLDGECAFQMRASANLGPLESVLSDNDFSPQKLSELVNGTIKVPLNELLVRREVDYKLRPLSFSGADEALVLETALQYGARVAAEQVPGSTVEITKEFPLAKSSQMWKGNELSNVLASKWTGRLGSAVGMNFTSDSPPSTLTGAIEGLFTIAYASWTAGFLVWAFHLSPSLDDVLHWQALVPTDSRSAMSLVLWTLPLVVAYCGLGLLRNQRNSDRWQDTEQGGSLPAFQQLTQVAKLAGDHLQRCNRKIRYNSDSDREDMRIRFILFTLLGCATNGVWLYGVLPAVATGAVGFAGGPITQNGAGAVIRGLFQVPLIALASAACVGVADLVATEGSDALTTGAKREDQTRWVENLFQVEVTDMTSGAASVAGFDHSDGKEMYSKVNLGKTVVGAQQQLQRRFEALGVANADAVVREAVAGLRGSPSEVVLDFKSALRGIAMNKQQDIVQPIAVFAVTFYLTLEVLLTKQVTNAVFTEFAAVCALDALSRPWDCSNMLVRVISDEPSRRRNLVDVVGQ